MQVDELNTSKLGAIQSGMLHECVRHALCELTSMHAEPHHSTANDYVELEPEVEKGDVVHASKVKEQLENDSFWNRCRALKELEFKVGPQVSES